MADVQLSGGTALADPPEQDEFALDVRLVVAYGPTLGDCPTDDGCGNTCAGDASACNSMAYDPS